MKSRIFYITILSLTLTLTHSIDLEPVDDQIIFIPIEDGADDGNEIPIIDEITDGNGSGNVVIDHELTDAEKLILGFEKQTIQPDWIRQMGIVSEDLHQRIAASEDFVEVVSPLVLAAFDKNNEDRKHLLIVSYIKASDWIFVTFTDSESNVKHEFFFPYTSLVEKETIFLREVSEECTRPETHVPSPPTIAKCHYFYKKISEAYDFSVKEVGPVQGAELMECYIESVKKMTRQPRVEILCVEGGIEDSQYRELTRSQYDQIKAQYEHLGNGVYEGQLEETETTRVNAK
jgi:hypothetical protein